MTEERVYDVEAIKDQYSISDSETNENRDVTGVHGYISLTYPSSFAGGSLYTDCAWQEASPEKLDTGNWVLCMTQSLKSCSS